MNTLPDALHLLSERLAIPTDEWWEHDADYQVGFFHRGHPAVRRFRYWQRDGVLRGLTIRGHAVGDTSWLEDATWSELEDLLFIDTDMTRLTVPPKVKRLDISDCRQLTELRFTGEVIPLTDLFAQRSGIERVSFPECPALRCLHLRSCAQLREVDFTSPPTNLGVLELEGCPELENLPVAAILQAELFYLDARGTTPRNCPTVFTDTESLSEDYLHRIRAWFRALEAGWELNHYVKLLINGNGEVGKSTLWCALKNQEADRCTCATDHETTHGIDLTIEPLDVEGVQFRGWDFGGQETYHGTHQLFFAEEAINILVTDYANEQKAVDQQAVTDRRGQTTFNHSVEYFYQRQKQRDRNGYFILVQSKDDGSGSIHPQVEELKQKHRLPVLQVDSKGAPDSVDDLRRKMVSLTKRHLKIWGMPFPNSWLEVRKQLTKNLDHLTLGRIMPIAQFRNWAIKKCGLSDAEAEYEALLHFLHAAGDLYRIGTSEDEDSMLILDIRWALEGIYRPLDRADFAAKARHASGKVWVKDLFQYIQDANYSYSKAELKVLLDFMLNCGICFVGDRKDYQHWNAELPEVLVFPQYLPREMSPKVRRGWERASNVKEYRGRLPYRDLTALHALLCELGRKAQEDHIWYFGIDLDLVDTKSDEDNQSPLPDGHVLIQLDVAKNETSAPELVVKLDLEEGGLAWWPSVKEWIDDRFRSLEWLADATAEASARKLTPAEARDNLGIPVAVWLRTFLAGKELSLDREQTAVQIALEQLNKPLWVRPNGIGDLPGAERFIIKCNPRVVHFLGHAKGGALEFLARSGQGGEVVGATELKRTFDCILDEAKALEVVLLNACFTEAVANSISRADLYVIGTVDKLSDKAATTFAQAFYAALIADEQPVPAAFVIGRKAAWQAEGDPEKYQLFYRGNNVTPLWKMPGR